jgi:CRP-like cAMP-binding protein
MDTFGQYKVLYETELHFSVTALSEVVIIKLSKEFFDNNYRHLPGL